MNFLILLTSTLIVTLSGLIFYRAVSGSSSILSSTISLLIVVGSLAIMRSSIIFDYLGIELFEVSFKKRLFFWIAGYLNPIAIILHIYFLGILTRPFKLFLLLLASISLTLEYLNPTLIGFESISLVQIILFILASFVLSALFLTLVSNSFDSEFKMWIVLLCAIEIVSVLMFLWQIEGLTTSDNTLGTLLQNNMQLIIMNVLILLAYTMLLVFPRILSGDIGFQLEFEEVELKHEFFANYRSMSIWRYTPGSILFHDQVKNQQILKELHQNSLAIYSTLKAFEKAYIKGTRELPSDLLELSQELNIKYSTLEVFFEIYNLFSWSKYINLLKVLKADYAISSGFLENNDMNALAHHSDFNNRISLYNNFKNIFGHSPSGSRHSN